MNIDTDPKKIEELLTRGVEKILPTKEGLAALLSSGKRIRLYQGFDPTGKDLHIGHMVGLRKLAQFQQMGHEVIFLIGDGTGQAGDPSGKITAREKFFDRDELRANAVNYVKQASRIVKFEDDNPAQIRFNGDWLNELKLKEILSIAGHFSLQQLSERDMFQERIKKSETVNMREFLYPLLQGYDSVAMEVDLEIGGNDQMFNMLAGRTLLREMKGKDKFVLTTPLLADSSGRKIGKSEGNVIGLTDKPDDLYGKIMSLSDEVVPNALNYLTDKVADLADVWQEPMKYKKLLAYEIVKQLNSEELARGAEQNFTSTFSKGETPEN
ncbi:MAG TPA: tyrosine--tRNA ligase, partial [Candidatus Paceibacterota bacterium]